MGRNWFLLLNEKEFRELGADLQNQASRWSVPGFINHIPGQAPCHQKQGQWNFVSFCFDGMGVLWLRFRGTIICVFFVVIFSCFLWDSFMHPRLIWNSICSLFFILILLPPPPDCWDHRHVPLVVWEIEPMTSWILGEHSPTVTSLPLYLLTVLRNIIKCF